MLLTHEVGHIVAAKLSGGEILAVEIAPGKLSSTILSRNPAPSFVVWAGFLSGWLLPFLSVPFWKTQRLYLGDTFKTFAGFCVLAGGAYLAVGGNESFADTGQLIALGWNHYVLIVIGAAVAVAGYIFTRRAIICLIAAFKNRSPSAGEVLAWWSILIVWYTVQFAISRSI